jgi:hypothetical protein
MGKGMVWVKIVIEDIHGNQVETDFVISAGDKIIIRATKQCTSHELQKIGEQMSKLLGKDDASLLVIPHYLEFRVIKVTP